MTWPFSFWIWRRRCLKFAWFWPFGALPLGPHGGHTYDLNNFESPTPKDDSCQVWLKSNHAFSRRRWKCKKFTDDARRTTHDGRKRTAIAHLSILLRWAKNVDLYEMKQTFSKLIFIVKLRLHVFFRFIVAFAEHFLINKKKWKGLVKDSVSHCGGSI